MSNRQFYVFLFCAIMVDTYAHSQHNGTGENLLEGYYRNTSLYDMLKMDLFVRILSKRVLDQNTEMSAVKAKVNEHNLKVMEITTEVKRNYSLVSSIQANQMFELASQRTLIEQQSVVIAKLNSSLQKQSEAIATLNAFMQGFASEIISFNATLKMEMDEVNRMREEMKNVSIGTHVCPEGYQQCNKSCYKVGEDAMSWANAYAYCKSNGAHLVVHESPAEQEYLRDIARKSRGRCVWVGASDALIEGTWLWFKTGKHADLIWYPGQPNNYRNSDCACMSQTFDYELVDEPCQNNYKFICEINLSD